MYQVLLADDEQWVLYGLTRLIPWEDYGFVIADTACDGIEALNKVRKNKPDLLISDIRMPGAGGLELVGKIRETGEQTIVVFISGYSDFEYARQAIRLGAFDYLIKQVEEEELIAVLKRVKDLLDSQNNGGQTDRIAVEETEPAQITAILDYIETHCTEELHLRNLAKQFFLTENYLSSYIRQQTNQTFTELLAAKRLALAQKLLLQTSLSVQEIAERVGYTEYSHFSKLFKKRTGYTLTEYRKKYTLGKGRKQ